MILIDFSQISYACTIEYLIMTKQPDATVELVRHMILNTMRSHIKKFKFEYGEVVVAYDSDNYWRKERFPNYKANRKKSRDKSPFNWTSIFTCIDTLKAEFKQHLPYKVLNVPGSEADDVIGCLTMNQPIGSKVLILSGDKDFVQLQTCVAHVRQFSPLQKTAIIDPTPELTLKQHIIRGDSGDGIPNILSADDVFVSGGRQKPIHEKKMIEWLKQKPEEFCIKDDMLRNYKRNQELIDLTYIPKHISESILGAYATTTHGTKNDFFNYLVASGLRELTGAADDF